MIIRIAMVLLFGLATAAVAQEETQIASGAVLRGLDKMSGDVVDI
jgi:hypothetical protein